MNRFKKIRDRIYLTLLFAVTLFLIMVATLFLVAILIYIFNSSDIIRIEADRIPLISFFIICLIFGFIISLIFSTIPLRPLRKIIEATDRIAAGDFSVRVPLKGQGEMLRLEQSINHMSAELGSVEMLRSDFISNFSHEFKTPIVSIRGFAKMLKREDLTREEQEEYLDIIIQESGRLAELSSNVLLLSKLEKQAILTDCTRFNLSEQIRQVIALLYDKWDSRHLQIDFDVPETDIRADSQLLKQVWINLLDNAIKYAHEGSTVTLHMENRAGNTIVTVTNTGDPVLPRTAAHVFDKFYQGDTSHAARGNGLGLPIARKIIEMHEGTIAMENDGERTSLIVTLPRGIPE